MKVLLITSLYVPDVAANAKRMHQFARFLTSRGHQVTILAGVPHYPLGRIHPDWRRRPFWITHENGMKVVRVWVYAAPGRKIWRKALNYISFFIMSVPAALFVGIKHDAIVAISPPLPSGLSAFFYSLLSRSPFVFDVQDLYPETAIQLGVLKGKRGIAFFEALERFIYRKSAQITVISDGFRNSVMRKGISGSKVTVMPNWADTSTFSPEVTPVDKQDLGLGERFTVMFLGTIGRAQGCEIIVEAATLLRNRGDIGFCLLGDGVARAALEMEAVKRELDKISFLDPVPHDDVPRYLVAADACLVHLVANDLYKVTLPSKIYEYLAIGKPILMGVEGEAAQLIKTSGSGLVFKPQSAEKLAEAVLTLAGSPSLCARLGHEGRSTASSIFSEMVDNFEQLLRGVEYSPTEAQEVN